MHVLSGGCGGGRMGPVYINRESDRMQTSAYMSTVNKPSTRDDKVLLGAACRTHARANARQACPKRFETANTGSVEVSWRLDWELWTRRRTMSMRH